MTYQEQLKHPMWQKKRLEVLEGRRFECESCGESDKQLHVHHAYYEKGLKAWEYPDEAYSCLCEACHNSEHELMSRLNKVIGLLTSGDREQVLGYALACSEPYLDAEPLSPEMMAGMADYYRIPHIKLEHYVINSAEITLHSIYEFARSFYRNTNAYISRGN